MPGVKNPMCNAFPRIGNSRFQNMLSLGNVRLDASLDSQISLHNVVAFLIKSIKIFCKVSRTT